MFFREPANWPVPSYVTSEWTDLVAEPGVVASILICNTTVDSIHLELRIIDDEEDVLWESPTMAIGAGEITTTDFNSLNVVGVQVLQMRADDQGLKVIASGAVVPA
jgi:hypothetical protein